MSEKLQKVMARAGFASRREAETWIEKGRVKVNGVTAKIGDRVDEDDKIVVDGKKVAAQLKSNHERRVILYNKPEDQVCTRKDPEGRP
ncbi:MAG: S4 domain-containing protein, partial [Gammaproteobacteria bacterium]|nr:S4 domain-containing protein [Gammaproteobacteria bacterium]